MKQYPKSGFFRCLGWVVAGLMWGLGSQGASAQGAAQDGPHILVLTSHEGFLSEAGQPTYADDGRQASNGLASTFGNVDADQATFPSRNLVPQPQKVDYLYGALSIRKVRKTGDPATQDIILKAPSADYPPFDPADPAATAPAAGKVRVVGSNQAGTQDTVVYVNDDTPMLDANDLASIFKSASGGRYDLIVAGSTYFKVTDEAYAALSSVMQDPNLKPGAMLFFMDSCCDASRSYSRNVERYMRDLLRPATHDPSLASGVGVNRLGLSPTAFNDDYHDFPVNFNPPNPAAVGNSDHAKVFAPVLPYMTGGYYQSMVNVPADNILYQPYNTAFQPDSVTPFDGQAYGAFFPPSQIFAGRGTCTFSVIDITPVDAVNYDKPNNKNLGQAFLNAARAGGACGGVASISASPDVTVTLAQPATTITLTLKNESISSQTSTQGDITGGRVEYTLPPNLQFASDNIVTTSCTTTTPGTDVTNTRTGFAVTHISIPFQQLCTITLPVTWVDDTALSGNQCIRFGANQRSLDIIPGIPNQFSTDQGQTNDIASTSVTCSSPELELTPSVLTGPYRVGDSVSYHVTVKNLSQTAAAPASGAFLSGLVPAGATQVSVTNAATNAPLTCAAPDTCALPADIAADDGSGANTAVFTVQFIAPSSAPTMNWRPSVSLGTPALEVTLDNNSAPLTASVQKQVSVASVITTSGPQSLAQYVGDVVGFTVGGCMNPVTSATTLNWPTPGAEVQAWGDAGVACNVAFTGSPDPSKLPVGYVLASPDPGITHTPDSLGNDHFVATWVAVPPGSLSVTGTIQGAPAPFPPELVGKTVNYSLTCAQSAAIPASGQLVIGADGSLTTTTSPVIPSGSSCSAMTIDGIDRLPPAPQNYEWKSSSAAPQGSNAFVAKLVMAPKQQVLTVTGIVTGAPATFPADLVGKTVSLSMNCTPDAALPDTVSLVIAATGNLSTSTQPSVSATSQCAPKLAEATPTLALPQGYEWKTSTVTPGSGNSSFQVTLTMAKKSVTPAGEATPVPTLGEWALYALSLLMLLAAGQQLRVRTKRHH